MDYLYCDCICGSSRGVCGCYGIGCGFSGKNDNANKGRRNAMPNKANAVANQVANGNISEAIDILINLLIFVDSIEPPPDWMTDSAKKNEVENKLNVLIELLNFM